MAERVAIVGQEKRFYDRVVQSVVRKDGDYVVLIEESDETAQKASGYMIDIKHIWFSYLSICKWAKIQ